MKLLPSGTHEGPKPVTPIIKLFFVLIILNTIVSVPVVAWISFKSHFNSPAAATIPMSYVLWAFLAVDVLLVGTFLLLNHLSQSD